MSSGERILFLDNSFKMCHCLSMSVMDKKVMQNEMTIFFSTDSPFLHIHIQGKVVKHEKLLLVDIKDSISYIGDDSQLEEQMLSVLVMTKFCSNSLTRNHRCQHLIVKFHKNSQGLSSAIYATLDLWRYTRFVGETGCGKEGEGV